MEYFGTRVVYNRSRKEAPVQMRTRTEPACGFALRWIEVRSVLDKRLMVARAGVQPATFALGVRRSMHLSYRAMYRAMPHTRVSGTRQKPGSKLKPRQCSTAASAFFVGPQPPQEAAKPQTVKG